MAANIPDFTIGDPRLDPNSYDLGMAEGQGKLRRMVDDFFTVLRARSQYFETRQPVLQKFVTLLTNEHAFEIAARQVPELRTYRDIDVRTKNSPQTSSLCKVVHALTDLRPHRSHEVAAGKAELGVVEKSLLGLIDSVLNNEEDVDERNAGVKAESEHMKEQVYSIVRVLTEADVDLRAKRGNAEALTRCIMDFGHQARRQLGIED